ncbi:MAG: rhodanese-like domain-containing protein [Candidatus Micrarchaeaceae archaeon]
MPVETVYKTQDAVSFFQAKLAYEIGPVGLDQAIKNKDQIQVIDMRTPELYAKAHVPGAINVSLDQIERDAHQLDKNKTVITYCYNITCHLATKGALALAEKGYKVKELVGGWQSWHETQKYAEEIQAASCNSTKGHSCD